MGRLASLRMSFVHHRTLRTFLQVEHKMNTSLAAPVVKRPRLTPPSPTPTPGQLQARRKISMLASSHHANHTSGLLPPSLPKPAAASEGKEEKREHVSTRPVRAASAKVAVATAAVAAVNSGALPVEVPDSPTPGERSILAEGGPLHGEGRPTGRAYMPLGAGSSSKRQQHQLGQAGADHGTGPSRASKRLRDKEEALAAAAAEMEQGQAMGGLEMDAWGNLRPASGGEALYSLAGPGGQGFIGGITMDASALGGMGGPGEQATFLGMQMGMAGMMPPGTYSLAMAPGAFHPALAQPMGATYLSSPPPGSVLTGAYVAAPAQGPMQAGPMGASQADLQAAHMQQQQHGAGMQAGPGQQQHGQVQVQGAQGGAGMELHALPAGGGMVAASAGPASMLLEMAPAQQAPTAQMAQAQQLQSMTEEVQAALPPGCQLLSMLPCKHSAEICGVVFSTPSGGAGAGLWQDKQLCVVRRFTNKEQAYDHTEVGLGVGQGFKREQACGLWQ